MSDRTRLDAEELRRILLKPNVMVSCLLNFWINVFSLFTILISVERVFNSIRYTIFFYKILFPLPQISPDDYQKTLTLLLECVPSEFQENIYILFILE